MNQKATRALAIALANRLAQAHPLDPVTPLEVERVLRFLDDLLPPPRLPKQVKEHIVHT